MDTLEPNRPLRSRSADVLLTRHDVTDLYWLLDREEWLSPRCYCAFYHKDTKALVCFHEEMYRLKQEVIERHLIAPAAVKRRKGHSLVLAALATEAGYRLYEELREFLKWQTRKARLKALQGHPLKEHYRVLWDIQGGRCYFTGAPLSERFEDRAYSVDHLYPTATRMFHVPRGSNWPINLALVVNRINAMKGSQSAEDFLAEARRSKAFVPRPTKERREIDDRRRAAFTSYMREHCSLDEDDWGQ